MLKKLAAGTDYFADLGRVPRLAAAVVLTPFALLFALGSVCTPIAAVSMAVKGDRQLALIVLASGLMNTLFAVPLCWLTVRLYRGRRAANGVTVLPTWIVRAFLFVFFGPLSVGMSVMIVVLAVQFAQNGDGRTAAILAAGAIGFVVGIVKAVRAALRLGRQKDGDETPGPATPNWSDNRTAPGPGGV